MVIKKKVKIETFPKEVLEKAEIIGNVFEDLKRMTMSLELVEFISSEESSNYPLEAKEQKIFGNLYQLAHLGVATCENCHEDWRKTWTEVYQKLKKDHII